MKQPPKTQLSKKPMCKQWNFVVSKMRHSFKNLFAPSQRTYLITTIFVLLFFFRQVVFYINPKIGYQLVGNLDVFYLLGVAYIMLHHKKISKIEITGILLLLLYPVLQSFPNVQYNFWRAYINIAKIILCYFTAKEAVIIVKKYNIQVKYGTMLFGYLCAFSLVLALIFQHNSVLWRLNDTVNVFNLKRLKLFYTEPGELGMHCSIILIIAVYTMTKVNNKLKYFLVAILPTILCLFFTKSLGGIAVGAVGITAVFVSDLRLNFSKRKLILYVATAFSVAIAAIIAIMSGSGMYLRVKKVFSNADSSSRYRIVMAFETVPDILKNTALLGTGFGNLELPHNVSKYQAHRLNSAGIINSYMNFIAESGILGIVLLFALIYILVKTCVYAKQPIAWGLTTFLIIYQFMGTYFTNPLIWILYGYIFAQRNAKHHINNALGNRRQTIAKTTGHKSLAIKKATGKTPIVNDSKSRQHADNKSPAKKCSMRRGFGEKRREIRPSLLQAARQPKCKI